MAASLLLRAARRRQLASPLGTLLAANVQSTSVANVCSGWGGFARTFSAKPTGNDVTGTGLGTTNSFVAMEGKATVDRLRPEICSEDEMARARETVNRLRAEYEKMQAEWEKQSIELDRILELIKQDAALVKQDAAKSKASYNEAMRHIKEERKRIMKDLENIDKACDVVLFSCPVLIILMTMAMQ